MTGGNGKAEPDPESKERGKRFYRIRQTAGKQFRKDSPGREATKVM